MNRLDVIDLSQAASGLARSHVIALSGVPRRPPARIAGHFTMRDRILVMNSADRAREAGFGRLNFERANITELGATREYLLIYGECSAWARYGVSVGTKGYKLWETARGGTLGVFPSLQAALDNLSCC